MQNRRGSILSSIDWITVGIYMLLLICGWFSIYSAGFDENSVSMFDLSQQYGKQVLWIGLALILAIFTMTIDQRFFEVYAYVIYLSFLLLLISVLFFGIEINGAKSWLNFGFVRLQPAEFAKIGTALALSAWMGRYGFDIRKPRDFVVMLGVLLTPMVLILLQNDLGSVLTYTSFIILFYRRGLSSVFLWVFFLAAVLFISVLSFTVLPVFIAIAIAIVFFLSILQLWKLLGIYVAVGLVFCGVWWALNYFEIAVVKPLVFIIVGLCLNLVYWFNYSYETRNDKLRILIYFALGAIIFIPLVEQLFSIFDTYQQDRILITLGLKSDPFGVEYHVIQSLIAIGSGGFSGKGFLQGTQTKFDFVPEQTTDFIFSTIGEEFGFIGTFIVIGLYLSLMLRLLFLAERQRSRFSQNYGYAIVGIIFFHFGINIGMVTGLGPVIGVPLPFLSYGGSSLWGFTLMLFIFLKMDACKMEVLGD